MKKQTIKKQRTKNRNSKLSAFFKKAKHFLRTKFLLLISKSPALTYYRNRFIQWRNSVKLNRAIKLCDAKTVSMNRQYHVFKIGNGYFINCRLDFKLSTRLSQKEKDRINVIKMRESAVYSSPLTLLKKHYQENYIRNTRK